MVQSSDGLVETVADKVASGATVALVVDEVVVVLKGAPDVDGFEVVNVVNCDVSGGPKGQRL